MQTENAETGNEENDDQVKEQRHTDINAITEVTNYEGSENQKITTVVNAKINQFVNSGENQESEKIDFVLFKTQKHQETIVDFSDECIRQFQLSRIMVISYANKFDEPALGAVQKIIFGADLNHNSKPICCSLHHHHTVNLSKLIRDVVEDKIFNAKEQQMLIVFEQRPEDVSDTFMANIKDKGGPANIITESLRSKKLYLIYVCQNNRLFETRPLAQTHFGLYLIDPYIKAFYETKKSAAIAMEHYLTAMDTIRLTGWLSEFSEQEKIDRLTKLSREDKLAEEASRQLQSIDKIKELKIAGELLADPVQNLILFTLTFFEGISLYEFDELVKTLLLSTTVLQNASQPDDVQSNCLSSWNTRGDTMLAECGVCLDNSDDKKTSSYRFLMEIRGNIVSDLLRQRYQLALVRRYEFIEEQLIRRPLNYSKAYINGWFKLFFETAALDPQRYLLRFAIRVVNLITDDDETIHDQDEKKQLLLILSSFIGKWEDNERLNPVISRFYDEMKKSADRRMLLGTLLSLHCTPEKPQMLKKLKAHLESISNEEIHFNLDVINSISFNYLEKIPELLDTIMEWTEPGAGNPRRSASHARCAHLLLFYQQWPYACKKYHLSYRIVKQLMSSDDGMEKLTVFIFGDGITEAFKLLHIDRYRQKYETEPLLKSTMAAHLYLMQAFVLVQWHYLLKLICFDDANATWEVNVVFERCTNTIEKFCDMTRLRAAVNRACVLLNFEIEENMGKTEKKNTVHLLMQKRDGARELLKLI